MSDFITLLGAEDVRNAGHRMQEAANQFRQSVAQLEDIFQQQQVFLNDWLLRYEDALAKGEKK